MNIVARPSDLFGRKAAGHSRWLISGQAQTTWFVLLARIFHQVRRETVGGV